MRGRRILQLCLKTAKTLQSIRMRDLGKLFVFYAAHFIQHVGLTNLQTRLPRCTLHATPWCDATSSGSPLLHGLNYKLNVTAKTCNRGRSLSRRRDRFVAGSDAIANCEADRWKCRVLYIKPNGLERVSQYSVGTGRKSTCSIRKGVKPLPL
jgi:hypothetical protein